MIIILIVVVVLALVFIVEFTREPRTIKYFTESFKKTGKWLYPMKEKK